MFKALVSVLVHATHMSRKDCHWNQTSQLATEVCREMWALSKASPPRGRVYPPRAQCGIIAAQKF